MRCASLPEIFSFSVGSAMFSARLPDRGPTAPLVLENTDTGAVCVYDIKTGKSGLRRLLAAPPSAGS
jgi:hypothetical protein